MKPGRARCQLVDVWLQKIRDDYHNVRVDVLEPPEIENEKRWVYETEIALINHFKPLFNQTYNHKL